MRSVDGPAQAGDYVAIIVMGATLVKVQDGETILAGQRLAAGVSTVGRYQKCLSGPLLNRIDIHVEVPRVDYEKLSGCEAS